MREPMRVIEGTAQPHEPFWRFRNAAESESGEVEIELFGPVSEYSWWGDEITPQMFKEELNSKGGGRPVTLLVNSPGGEVIAASVIRSILQDYSGKVTADIVGLAASAATIVVTGADHIRMRESALFMIHDPSGIAWGTIDEIKEFLGILKIVKDTIVDVYETKTKLEPTKLAKMMSDETWMTAREAKDYGFVDEVVTIGKKKSQAVPTPAGFANCLSKYVNVPAVLAALLARSQQAGRPVLGQAQEPDEVRRLRAEVQILKKE